MPFLKHYNWEKAHRDGSEAAASHVALLRELDYEMDLLKVTPFYKYMASCWGTKFRFRNNDENVEDIEFVVKETRDWKKLWVLDPRKELRENLRTVTILSREIGTKMPFIYTVFSPIVQALHHVSTPERVYADMESSPDLLKEGLETITQTCIDFAKACVSEGAAGILFGIGGRDGQYWSKMNRRQLAEYALHYDKKVLDALKDVPIRLLHICGIDGDNPQQNGGLIEDGWFKQYPVNAINWSDACFTPGSVAKKIYGKDFCLVCGIDYSRTMRQGTPEQIDNEIKASIEGVADGGGFIIGPGCTLFQDTPLANFNAVGRAVEKYGRYRR